MTRISVMEDTPSPYGVQPWERQPRESDREWELFQQWRGMAYPDGLEGPFKARTTKALALTTGVASAALMALVGTRNWCERAAAFDRELDVRRTEAGLNVIERNARRHQRLLDQMLTSVDMAHAQFQARVEAGEQMTASEIRQWADTVIKLQRLVTGQSTENVAVVVLYDLSRLELSELETFRALEAKARVPQVDKASAPELH
jgi:hypothetical protein